MASGTPEHVARMFVTLYTPARDGLTSFATDHIEQLTGHAPMTLEAFLERVWSA
jgi:hypothetical protein